MRPHPNAAIQHLLDEMTVLGPAGIELSLGRMEALLEALGNPHHHLPPVIHVAGTNGKGSVVAYLRAMGEAAGLRVHSYTSPELVRFNERMMLNGVEVHDDTLLPAMQRVRDALMKHPATIFESTTAVAFLLYAEHPADFLLLEVGMGGRLDATNMVARPMLSVITPVSMDHVEFLGDSLDAIAREKAGILKPGVPAVIGMQEPEAIGAITDEAMQHPCPLFRHGQEWRVEVRDEQAHYQSASMALAYPAPALAGPHQWLNAGMAIACADQLRRHGDARFHWNESIILKGLVTARHKARMQRLTHPALLPMLPEGSEVWLDGGHNASAGAAIAQQLARWRAEGKPVMLLTGMMKDKDMQGFLVPLAPYVAQAMLVGMPENPRAAKPESLLDAAKGLNMPAETAPDWLSGFKKLAKTLKNPCKLLICGSLALAGEVLCDYDNAS
ncbi:bifunctional folylpolyglutamate synthase/dihydrofolate synthase [bacterium]|nr:bifunctional folylpolyglutamate synthase/dihydrofolate synthase [bacterium]